MQTADTSLLQVLQSLEVELHKPAARSDAGRLDALLHDDFREFGLSGAFYTKVDIMLRLPAEAQHAVVVADRFELRRLGECVVLLTYRSARRLPDGNLDGFARRSSVWEHSSLGWQMSFHQGTPTAPYEPGDGIAAADFGEGDR
ncbi:nuclear transport factor 2 family protein [Xanthomonas hyacinthi]|uniref:DUF4440 domain-containing protein n=1 Tax=Xanthomonas hyacinthi TaxID=56455 RepID=A0A2S7EQM1_9XANT|nr:nuclear transport factor 2 family protein [Xanthomonas hyacinthi]PPU95416.1 hypothetical protein XhyaCFBP1156_18805 [Xanthomonas hyacinthi]QGY78801.1 nuclear transport factor 2 family protein [Xanthomonas hyacinthi]